MKVDSSCITDIWRQPGNKPTRFSFGAANKDGYECSLLLHQTDATLQILLQNQKVAAQRVKPLLV